MSALISTQVHEAAEELIRLARTPGGSVGQELHTTLNRFLSWPYRAALGLATGVDGQRTKQFAVVIYTRTQNEPSTEPVEIPLDALACVIDVSERMDLEHFRAAYANVAHAKSLRKSPAPHLGGVPHT